MDDVVKSFVESPSFSGLEFCDKKQVVAIGEYFQVDVGDLRRGVDQVRSSLLSGLVEKGVLKEEQVLDPGMAGAALTFEQQRELLLLRAQSEEQRGRLELERMKLDLERQRLELIRDGRMEADGTRPRGANGSDELSDLRLVPKFNEEDPESFFSLFERLAETRGWSDSTRLLLLQCVLVGKAQRAYSALGSGDWAQYAVVKATVLKAYELVPEAYRQRFRGWRRGDKSHLEFMRVLVTHFDSWCSSAGVKTMGDLRELILLEQFKNSVSEQIAVYVSERGAKTVAEAAALSDDYHLVHSGKTFDTCGRDRFGGSAEAVVQPSRPRVSDQTCYYCHKPGHFKKDCYALKSRFGSTSSRPVVCAASVVGSGFPEMAALGTPELGSYLPFITEGFVSLVGSRERVRVRILRDTGAADSFIVASVLPFSEASSLGTCVPIMGMGMSDLSVPQHKMVLDCDFFQGEVSIGVRPALPVGGVSLILGNDIAGSRVWADVPPPVKVAIGSTVCGDHGEESCLPEVLGACVVTRSKGKLNVAAEDAPISDFALPAAPWSVSRGELVDEQGADGTLKGLFELVCCPSEVRSSSHCYFIHEGVLMRKWWPQLGGFVGDPVYQVVVPSKFRGVVLQLSHDQCGHLGVRKTYDRILGYFFWPRLKRDVSAYCRSCHTCQVVGKPGLTLKPVPLSPIPAISQPGRMKASCDKRAVLRDFLPGDKVLALLPLVSSPFQARFSGPYSVVEKLSDLNYLIATPGRRSKTRLCHTNLLKPYFATTVLDQGEGMSVAWSFGALVWGPFFVRGGCYDPGGLEGGDCSGCTVAPASALFPGALAGADDRRRDSCLAIMCSGIKARVGASLWRPDPGSCSCSAHPWNLRPSSAFTSRAHSIWPCSHHPVPLGHLSFAHLR